jgi:hypothetical protein
MDWRSSPECTELMPPMDDFSNSLLEAGMVPLKSKAREVGANGVIIDGYPLKAGQIGYRSGTLKS